MLTQDTEANIKIDTQEIKQDTEKAIDETTADDSAADHQSTPKPGSVDQREETDVTSESTEVTVPHGRS